ncbi:hypothetical protein PR048_032960 [Dryococelus australis]|uniref:MULE transposase domain-containing protein n=1 Tax=Dryococelus australis TaxID=614101 RepID=A0ABQ9G3Q2_9NEOP|nr:hypothetical protein PR048_032960 [Dryococelus australis]
MDHSLGDEPFFGGVELAVFGEWLGEGFVYAPKNTAVCAALPDVVICCTTNPLINHLSAKYNKHYALYTAEQNKHTVTRSEKQKFAEENKGTITTYLKSFKWPQSSKDAQSVARKIAKFVPNEDAYPPYTVPSRRTLLRSVVPSLFQSTKQQLKMEMCDDMRKNLHFINWTLCNRYFSNEIKTLKLLPNDRVTHCRMYSKVFFSKWEIPCTIPVYVVTDNAHDIGATVIPMAWNSVPCFVHTLQLSIHDAENMTPGVENVCKKDRKIVGHYSRSSTARHCLQQKKCQMGLVCVLDVIQDVETRWNSKYQVLKRLIVLKEEIAAKLASEPYCNIDSLPASE